MASKKRTITQNKSLHLYFKMISDELNELGIEFCYQGLKGIDLSVPYTPIIFKELFWKPVQKTLFDINSTTDLTTSQIDIMINVFNKFFAEKGVLLEFPSIEMLMSSYGEM